MLFDSGGREGPDRLKDSRVSCGTMGITCAGDVAGENEVEGEDDSGDGCKSAGDAVEHCCCVSQ